MPHVPSELFQFSAHLSLSLPEIPSRCWQNPAFETHLLAAATRIVWHFVLFNIASNLSCQSARLFIRQMQVAMRGGTFCCRHSTHAFRLGVVISEILRPRYPQLVSCTETALQQQQFAINRRNKAYKCREEARHEAERNRSKEISFLRRHRTCCNRCESGRRGTTEEGPLGRPLSCLWFRIFSDLALSPRSFSYKSDRLVLRVGANEAFDCVWLMLASAVDHSVKIPMPRSAKL
jgi:hypothetical protein